MDFSKVKLVVSDMDGTLLNSRHELSPEFFPLLEKMKSRNIKFVAASGRQYYNLLEKFKEVADDIYFIAENGSYVVHRKQDLLVQSMDPGLTREQLKVARGINGVYPILCGKKQAYIEDRNEKFLKNVKLYYERFKFVDDLLQVENDDILKIALCDLNGAETNSYPHFEHLKDQLQVKVSGEIWLDLSHLLANKGRALDKLQKKLACTYNETMAFGDYLNDLELIQQARYSYAVANAHSEIKSAAKFITKSNDEGGVIEVLKTMLDA